MQTMRQAITQAAIKVTKTAVRVMTEVVDLEVYDQKECSRQTTIKAANI